MLKKEKDENLIIEIESNKTVIQIKNYKYMSEFLTTLPVGYIDKGICNCGASSLVLENDENSILLVPTLALQKNKIVQYNHNDMSKKRVKHNLIEVNGSTSIDDIFRQCLINKEKEWPIKLITTYDSFYKLEDIIDKFNFRIFVDEADKMLSFLKMKVVNKKTGTSVIDDMYDICEKHKDKVTFFTASPIDVKYLPDLMATLPYYEFKWENIVYKKIYKRKENNPTRFVNKYIINHIKKQGYFTFNEENNIKVNKIIIYVNSIATIKNIIKTNKLNVEDVAIVCGTQSMEKIKPYKYLDNPYELPKFTFCTCTAFFGIDFYDETALPIIISDTYKNYTMINAELDLKQAMSRIRTATNQFYGTALFVYNTSIFELSETELINDLNESKNKLQYDIEFINGQDNLASRNRILNMLNSNEMFRTYTILKDSYALLNEKVYLADIHFLLETRRAFNEGFKVKKDNNHTDLEVVSITNLSSAMYKDYAIYYSLAEDKSYWPNKYINYDYKEKIKAVYEHTGNVPLSIQGLNTQYNKIELEKQKEIIEKILYKKMKVDTGYTSKQMKDVISDIKEVINNDYVTITFLIKNFNIKKSTLKINNKTTFVYALKKL